MAKKIKCYNCGKEIQSDFLSCPYCRADLPEIDSTNHTKLNLNQTENEEYFEEEDLYEDNEEASNELSQDMTEAEKEEYFEEDEYFNNTEDEIEDESEASLEEDDIDEPEEYFEEDDYIEEFTPINIHLSESKQTVKQETKAYDANADHYYDDVLPEILDDIKTNKFENVLKVVGCILGLFFIMWYLIYFL